MPSQAGDYSTTAEEYMDMVIKAEFARQERARDAAMNARNARQQIFWGMGILALAGLAVISSVPAAWKRAVIDKYL